MKNFYQSIRTLASTNAFLVTLLATAFLSACASPINIFRNAPATEIFYKDGRVAYLTSCKSTNWGPCLEKAGMICRNVGYSILEKNNQMSYGEADKELVFACNGKPDPMGDVPTSNDATSSLFPKSD